MNIDIGDVIRHSGLPASTLRYYEEKGLIKSIGRNGLRRLYASNILERLALITLGRNAGFSLDEIAILFSSNKSHIDRKALNDKAIQIDEKIKELTAMRNGLQHAANCPEDNQLDCPKFQRLLNLSTRKQRKNNTSFNG